MPDLNFLPCADARHFQERLAPWLEQDPTPFALACGVAEQLATPGAWAGVLTRNQEPLVALVQTPPLPIILAAAGPVDTAALQGVADQLRQRASAQHGINGPSAWVEALALELRAQVSKRQGVRLHRLLGEPRLPRPVAGVRRSFRPEEDELLAAWCLGFQRDALPEHPAPQLDPAALQSLRAHSLVWAVDDRPVSMARRVRPVLGGWTIGAVYTPPALRGRGYAGAVVQGLSAQLLQEGAQYVALYTDLGNPISNHLYARIGFVPCLDQTKITWQFS